MDVKSILKKLYINTCVIFTVATVLYCILVGIINSDADEILFEAKRIVLFFFFALIVSLANAIFSVKLIPTPLRYVIHYILCGFAFYLCLLFPANTASLAGFVLIGLSLFTVAYVIVNVLISIFKSKKQRKKEKKETYTKRFSK